MKKIAAVIFMIVSALVIGASSAHAQWPTASITPDPLEFPDTLVGQTAGPSTLTVTNTSSNIPLAIFSVKLSDAVSFAIATDNCSQTVINPGETCTVGVAFTPSASGHYEASVSVISTGSGIVTSATITGQGIAPLALLAPSAIDFGDHTIGFEGEARAAILTNAGTAALNIANIETDSVFNLVDTDCVSPLAPFASCTIHVSATPTVLGPATGNLFVFDDSPITPQTAALSVNGIAPGQADIGFSATALDFGGQLVGSTSDPLTITISSQGTVALEISNIAVTGGFAETDDCRLPLAPDATCTITVTFSPATIGPLTGTIVLTDNATDSPQTITLSGYGFTLPGPQASLSATTLVFGDEQVNSKSDDQTLTVTNTGGADLVVQLTSLDGDDAANFGKLDNCSGVTLATGQSCTIVVWFLPLNTGDMTAILSIADNTSDSPQLVSLSGAGISPPGTGGCTLVAQPPSASPFALWTMVSMIVPIMVIKRRKS